MPPFTPAQKRLILVCCNTKEGTDSKYCGNCGGAELHAELKKYVNEKGLSKMVRVVKSGCLDYCGRGPIVCIEPEHVWYENVKKEDLEELKKKYVDSFSLT